MEIDKNGGFNGYEDDTNMTDEEFEEFERYLQSWLNDIEDEKERERITNLTNKVLDVDSVITEFLLIDEETRNRMKDMSDTEINKIKDILKQQRKSGKTCHFYKRYGIKYLGDTGKFDKMLDWEKEYYNKHHRKDVK